MMPATSAIDIHKIPVLAKRGAHPIQEDPVRLTEVALKRRDQVTDVILPKDFAEQDGSESGQAPVSFPFKRRDKTRFAVRSLNQNLIAGIADKGVE